MLDWADIHRPELPVCWIVTGICFGFGSLHDTSLKLLLRCSELIQLFVCIPDLLCVAMHRWTHDRSHCSCSCSPLACLGSSRSCSCCQTSPMLALVGSPCSGPQSQSGNINFKNWNREKAPIRGCVPEVGPNGLKQQARQYSGCPGKRASGPCYIQSK